MISVIIVLSLAIYLGFAYWDRKQVKDEREKLIDLKTSELQSKVTLWSLVVLAILYWVVPDLPAWVCLLVINFANLYSEIFGKIYLRYKI